MEIENFITQDLIEVNMKFNSRYEVLEYMAKKLISEGYAKSSFVDAILEREAHYPSAIAFDPMPIAIPHVDAAHVLQSTVFFLRLKNPLEFQMMGSPEEKIDVYFISMFALKDKEHIGKVLTSLITAYQDVHLITQLWSAKGHDEVYQLLIEKMSDVS